MSNERTASTLDMATADGLYITEHVGTNALLTWHNDASDVRSEWLPQVDVGDFLDFLKAAGFKPHSPVNAFMSYWHK